jgi:hypothetical protein
MLKVKTFFLLPYSFYPLHPLKANPLPFFLFLTIDRSPFLCNRTARPTIEAEDRPKFVSFHSI